jgi:LmbE family N-acetylglucosaminyl deacetylase
MAPEWFGRAPALRRRLVVVAPHPDDEVFAAAGLMRWAIGCGATVQIVAVTDGENSHAASSAITPRQLVRRRAAERAAALAHLDLAAVRVHRLGLPDAAVSQHEAAVASRLATLADHDTVIVSPPPDDGHPDHDAAGRASWQGAMASGAGCWFTPIWSRVHGSGPDPTAVLHLHDLHPTKRTAAQSFATQLLPLGSGPHDGPVVHPAEAESLLSATEHIIEAMA